MSAAIFLAVTLIGSMIVLMREVLILTGLLKGPILQLYEQYGDDDPIYYPWPRICYALAVFSAGIGWWVTPYANTCLLPFGPTLFLVFAGWFANDRKYLARRQPQIFQHYPRWVSTLHDYTNREERRRIAYYWLGLPLRTRLLFNSSDRAFLNWADLIVLST